MKRVSLTNTMLIASALLLVSTPALAQIDLTGNWVSLQHEDWQERGPGPEVVDYLGMPINEEARSRALTYSTTALSLPERQCLYYAQHYVVIGPFGLKIWSDTDRVTGDVVSWHIGAVIDRAIITIWIDGRQAPPEGALHTFEGFTTGEWDGTTLRTRTTHIKEGYVRRNGVPTSDQSTFNMEFKRHGDLLTVTAFIEDPVYLTEPFVISRTWRLDPTSNMRRVPNPCVPQAELPGLVGDGDVPHYLPGANPGVMDVTNMYNIPLETVMGGAETMYPEYRNQIREAYEPPTMCTRYCCGWEGNFARTSALNCIGRPGR